MLHKWGLTVGMPFLVQHAECIPNRNNEMKMRLQAGLDMKELPSCKKSFSGYNDSESSFEKKNAILRSQPNLPSGAIYAKLLGTFHEFRT